MYSLSLVELTCSSIKSVCFFRSLSAFCIDGILSIQVIMEFVHKEVKLLYSALLIDVEFARILFNELATNKIIIIVDINNDKDNLLYF